MQRLEKRKRDEVILLSRYGTQPRRAARRLPIVDYLLSNRWAGLCVGEKAKRSRIEKNEMKGRNLRYKFLDGYPTDAPSSKTNTQLITILVY